MTDEEEATAQLLRLAGARPDPPAERAAQVRERVHREWRASRRRRAIRRGAAATAVCLAAAAVLILAVRMKAPRDAAPSQREQILATGERMEGVPVLRRQLEGRSDVQPLSLSASIHAGDAIETDGASRAALRATDGSSVRLDRGSRIRLIAPAVIELVEGAVYVATSEGSHGFEVRTSMGAVRDVGTRFEVRLSDTSLRLRVRAGAIEIRHGAAVTSAAAGTEATVTASGVATRQVPAYGPGWEWTAGLARPFTIEGRPLRAFLEHVAGEEGWTLRYADPTLADAASRIVLHGSVDGLAAEAALGVALTTSGLQYRLRGGDLLVSRPVEAR
jgi:ferric-dicitrate binding protein FerR (iron transport regulator)